MIKKIRDGEPTPEGGKYLQSVVLPDEEKAYGGPWRPASFVDGLPIIGFLLGGHETRDVIIPNGLFHLYEVADGNS